MTEPCICGHSYWVHNPRCGFEKLGGCSYHQSVSEDVRPKFVAEEEDC